MPIWVFTLAFKISAALHYTLLSTLGERVLPIWAVGLVIGGGALIQVALDIPAGFILDAYGYIRVLKVGTAAFISAVVCLWLGMTPITFFLTVLLSAFGWLFFEPGIDAYLLSRTKKEVAGRFMACRDIVKAAGVVLGMVILPFVIEQPSQYIGWVLLIPFLIALTALFFLPQDAPSVHREQKIKAQGYYIRRHLPHRLIVALKQLNPASFILLLSGFSSSAFYGIIWFVVPLMMVHASHDGVLGIGLSVFDFAVLIVGYAAGELTDHWDKRWLVFWGLLLFSICAALLGFYEGILFLVVGFLATTGDELSSVSLWAWIDHLDKKHLDDALVTGAISFTQDLGWSAGPIIAGFLFGIVGPSWTIAAGAFFIFCTWLISSVYLKEIVLPFVPSGVRDYFPKKKRHKA